VLSLEIKASGREAFNKNNKARKFPVISILERTLLTVG